MGLVRLFVIYLLVSLEKSEASSDEILALVRHRHEQTGQCRLSCVQELATVPRDTDCQRHNFCSSCWTLCREFGAQKNFRRAFCASDEPSCDRGCRQACEFFDDDVKRQPRNRKMKELKSELPEVELSTSLVGCTLYWKASGIKESVYLHQLYGLDEQDTWFDLGQTVESFHTFRPEEAMRAVKIRLMAVDSDKGIVAETGLAMDGRVCEDDPLQPQKEHLLQNATAVTSSTLVDPNSALIVTTTILLVAFTVVIAAVAVRHRKWIKDLLNRRRDLQSAAQSHPASNPEPNNRRFSEYLRAVTDETPRHVPIAGSSPGSHSLYV